MSRGTTLKLLIGIAALSWMGLNAGTGADFPSLQKIKLEGEALEKGTLGVTKKDVDVDLRGRVRNDGLFYDKIYTLRASNDDQLAGFRTKACVDLQAAYGRQTFGRSAADARLLLTNYGFWKREYKYTPFRDTANDDRKADVGTMNLLTYVEEAWVNLHFGTFFDAFNSWYSLEKHPVSLKIGYFPYQLGRGISFGDHVQHIPYLGFDSYGYDDTRSNHPGILVHGYINKDISYDLYYSKQTENTVSRSMTWKTINSNRTDGRRQWRGIRKETDLFSARMDLKSMRSWGDLHVQPYGMYIDAPELKLEFLGDASSRLGTVGAMLEYKKGGFSINAEVAGQFGHQNVHAIDRNETVVESNASGVQTAYYTHVLTTADGPTKVVATPTLDVTINSLANKGGYDSTNKTFVKAVTKNGDEITTSVYNSSVSGNARFRDGYRIDYNGFMGVVDMMYEFEKVPVSICAAGAYISGDNYPYNTEEDKRYKGFITYGDYNYVGKYVYSQVILEARKLPRPVDISYNHQYAFNNVKDCSNLAYLGLATKWNPFKDDKAKLELQTNVLWYWETTTLKKWDKEGSIDAHAITNATGSTEVWSTGDGDDIWTNGSHRVGWKSCNDASRELGTELNFQSIYRPVPNCLFLVQAGCFIPGQLYKDLDGQPNERTKDGPKAYEGIYGLGHDTVWRLAFSLDYRF